MERVNLDALEALANGFIDEAQAQRIIASRNVLSALIAELRQLRQEADRARWCEQMKANVSWSDITRRWRVSWVAGGLFDLATDPDRNAAIDAALGVK